MRNSPDRFSYSSGVGETFTTNHSDSFLQYRHPVDQPRQFLAVDLVVRRIACINIGAIEASETPFGEATVAWPDLDQAWGNTFGLGAKVR